MSQSLSMFRVGIVAAILTGCASGESVPKVVEATPPQSAELREVSQTSGFETRESSPLFLDRALLGNLAQQYTFASTVDAQPQQSKTKTPDVVYVPTPQPVVDKMLSLAKIKKGDVVYDLGCGDGRIVVTAAKRYGVKAYGFDVDPQRVAEARENVRKNKVEHLVTIEQKDIFELDLSKANVVTMYLLPELNRRLIPQLRKLKPGSRIVSHDFDMTPIEPEQVVEMEQRSKTHYVYLWTSPI